MKNMNMTLAEIKQATKAGNLVYWMNRGYIVTYTKFPSGTEQWLVCCESSDSCTSLVNGEGKLNGKPEDFFISPLDEIILDDPEILITSQKWTCGDYTGELREQSCGEIYIDWDTADVPKNYQAIEERIFEAFNEQGEKKQTQNVITVTQPFLTFSGTPETAMQLIENIHANDCINMLSDFAFSIELELQNQGYIDANFDQIRN